MSRRGTICAGVVLTVLSLGVAACNRHPVESRIKSVEARIDGITCPTCVPPLKASLRRHYAKSTIEVDDDKDTATVRFAENEDFTPGEFRTAVERVRMNVVTVRLQACGTIETTGNQKWLTSGKMKFLLRSDRELPASAPVCADGTLDNRTDPATLNVSAFSIQGS